MSLMEGRVLLFHGVGQPPEQEWDSEMKARLEKDREPTAQAEQPMPMKPAGLFYILRSGGAAGIMVRRFISIALLVPAIVCTTEYIAVHDGLFESVASLAFTASITSVFFLLM